MKKTIIYLIGLVILALLIGFGISIYLTADISATLSPIKEYICEDDAVQLIEKIHSLASKNPQITFEDEKMLENKSNGYPSDITLIIKEGSDSLLYDLKLLNIRGMKSRSKLQLIGAHNLTNNTGGYGIKADGMNKLLDLFNQNIITPLKMDNGVTLKPL